MATLTRAQMEQVIRDGGSVLHGGQIITRIEHLPAEAQLAKGDPAKEAAVTQSLQEQIATLQAQLASLQPVQGSGARESEIKQSLGLTSVDLSTDAALQDAGFGTREALRAATDDELLAVPGIGPATLKKLRDELGA